jgi:RNA polymerase sigma factor (sigma-70 family)
MLQTTPPTTHPLVEPTDGELLFRFVGERSEEAFRRLVDRHARLVVSVCRRVLWHEQDVEDAFQATFLVLVRRADGLRRRDSFAAWLFQVARRIALRASDRRRRDATADDADSAASGGTPLDRLQDREEFEILATELERLPESYRLPLVLHYLEGHTRAALAEQLDCTEASVKARLARGRRLLRRRLMRRGVALSVALGALAIPTTTQAGLVAATTSAAVYQATGGTAGSAASTGSLTLAQGLPTMLALPAAKAAGIVGTTLAATLLVAVGVALSQPPEGGVAPSDGPANGSTTIDSRAATADEEAPREQPIPALVERRAADAAAAGDDATAKAEALRERDAAALQNANLELQKRREEVNMLMREVDRLGEEADRKESLLKRQIADLESKIHSFERLEFERQEHGQDLLRKDLALNFDNAPLDEVLRLFRKETGLNVIYDVGIRRAGWDSKRLAEALVTADVQGVTARRALELVLEPHGLAADFDRGFVHVRLSPAAERDLRMQTASIDMKALRPSEQRIANALTEQTQMEFVDVPLSEGIEFLSDLHAIPAVIDEQALEEEGIPLDEPINRVISGVSLESGLNLILDPLGLTYVVEDEVMKITTQTVADAKQEIRVYPVGTLVDAGLLETETMSELLLQQETGKVVTGAGVVTITQSQAAHRRTRELLEQMHRAVPAEEE